MGSSSVNTRRYRLHEGEKILNVSKPQESAALYFLVAKLGRVFISLLIIGGWLYIDLSGRNSTAIANQFGTALSSYYFWILLGFIVLLVSSYLWLRGVIGGYDYTITNQRIILHYGFISQNTRIIPYSQLNDVNCQASLIERMFGLETVYLDTVANTVNMSRRRSSNNTTRMEGLKHDIAEEAMDLISKYMISKN